MLRDDRRDARDLIEALLTENKELVANDEALMRERSIQESRAEAAEARVRELETGIEDSRNAASSPSGEVQPPPEGICGLCGQPMPPGEEMFMYHGYSGPCPTEKEQ